MIRRRGLASSCPFCGGEDLAYLPPSAAQSDIPYCHACGADRETTWNMSNEAIWCRSEALPQLGVLEVDYQDPFTTTMDGEF